MSEEFKAQDYNTLDLAIVPCACKDCHLEWYSTEHSERCVHCEKDHKILMQDARIAQLEAGLKEIRDSAFCQYGADKDLYAMGVVDGHRYCSNLARTVLGDLK